MSNTLSENEILKTGTIKMYKPGQIIADEGSVETGWYILLEGKVGVFKNKQKINEFDKKGIIFGEISSILEIPRTASLIALENTKVLFFKASVDHLIVHYPELAKKIMTNLAERLMKTTNDLILLSEKTKE